jgi:hypothetical protein
MSQQIIDTLKTYLDDKSNVNKKDVIKVVSDAFDEYKSQMKKPTGVKKEEEKKEKKITAYAMYLKEKMAELKDQYNAKERMKIIGEMWSNETEEVKASYKP